LDIKKHLPKIINLGGIMNEKYNQDILLKLEEIAKLLNLINDGISKGFYHISYQQTSLIKEINKKR
jgi:hypothetical protein